MSNSDTLKAQLIARLKTLSKPSQIAMLLAAKQLKQERMIEAFRKNPPFRNKAELMAMSEEQLEQAKPLIHDFNPRLSVKQQLWEQYEDILEYIE